MPAGTGTAAWVDRAPRVAPTLGLSPWEEWLSERNLRLGVDWINERAFLVTTTHPHYGVRFSIPPRWVNPRQVAHDLAMRAEQVLAAQGQHSA